jgi:hypothetical protein
VLDPISSEEILVFYSFICGLGLNLWWAFRFVKKLFSDTHSTQVEDAL